MLSSVFFRHSAGGMYYHQRHFPKSFATKFAFDYNGRPLGKGKTPNEAVAHMVQLRRGLSRYPPPPEAQRRAVAAVHLRVGDVLEMDPQGVPSLLCHGGGTQVAWHQTMATAVRPLLYAQPAAYYDFVARELRSRGVSEVTLVAASSYNMTGAVLAGHVAGRRADPGSATADDVAYATSCEYVSAVGRAFRDWGFAVSHRLGAAPDDDLVFFSSVGVYVPSGGTFSSIAADGAT